MIGGMAHDRRIATDARTCLRVAIGSNYEAFDRWMRTCGLVDRHEMAADGHQVRSSTRIAEARAAASRLVAGRVRPWARRSTWTS